VAIAGELWSFWGQNFLNLLRFKIHFASKLAFKNRVGFKTFINLCKVWGFFCRQSRHLKCNFGSKLVEVRRGTPALYRPQVFPSYNLPIPWQVLTFGEFILGFSLGKS
jgi:hypothetical protein